MGMMIPPYVYGSAKERYRQLCDELGGPPSKGWRQMKVAGLAILEDKHYRGKTDDIEVSLIERERRLLGLPPQ